MEAPGKPGAKKRPPTTRQLPWAELGTGRVQVEFGRATDDGGVADEDVEEVDLDEDEPADTDDDVSQLRGGGQ